MAFMLMLNWLQNVPAMSADALVYASAAQPDFYPLTKFLNDAISRVPFDVTKKSAPEDKKDVRVISRTKAEGTIIIHMNLDLRLLRKTNIQFNEVGSEFLLFS